MMTPFLESLQTNCHLSDKVIEILIGEEMTEHPHFKGCTEEGLKKIGLKLGPASAISTYIQSLTISSIPTNPSSLRRSDELLKLQLIEETKEEKFEKLALKFNAGNKTVVSEILKLGILRVVQNSDDSINNEETLLMLNYLGDVSKIWIGKDGISRSIVLVSKLNDSYIYLYFRNGKHLQNGIDPNTLINWQSLGDETLNLLWFANSKELLGNKDDDKIFEEFKMQVNSFNAAKLEYKADGFKPLQFIDYVKIAVSDLQNSNFRPNLEDPKKNSLDEGSKKTKVNQLYDLIIASLRNDDLRKICHYSNLSELEESINFNDAPMKVVTELIDQSIRRGLLKEFFVCFSAEIPRRRSEIVKIAKLFDIVL